MSKQDIRNRIAAARGQSQPPAANHAARPAQHQAQTTGGAAGTSLRSRDIASRIEAARAKRIQELAASQTGLRRDTAARDDAGARDRFAQRHPEYTGGEAGAANRARNSEKVLRQATEAAALGEGAKRLNKSENGFGSGATGFGAGASNTKSYYSDTAEQIKALETQLDALDQERSDLTRKIGFTSGYGYPQNTEQMNHLTELNEQIKEIKKRISDFTPIYDSGTVEGLQKTLENADTALTSRWSTSDDFEAYAEERQDALNRQGSALQSLIEYYEQNPSQELQSRLQKAYNQYEKDRTDYNQTVEEYAALADTFNAALNEYNAYVDTAKSDASGWEIAGDAALKGMSSFNRGVTSTLALPEKILGMIFPGARGPLSDLADYAADLDEYHANELADSTYGRGAVVKTAADLGAGTVAALPNAILAILSGGTSLAGQGATLATGAANSGLASTIGTSIKAMANNPMYWSSFLQTAGTDFEEAKEGGASDVQALATAIISSGLNAAVEIGGGIETLPEQVRRGGASAVKEWVKSMYDEGKEEVIQNIITGITQKVVYDTDKTLFTGEDPIVNPAELGQDFLMGAGVGGILGGGQIAANSALNAAANRISSNQYTEAGTQRQTAVDGVANKGVNGQKNSAEAQGIDAADGNNTRLNESDLQPYIKVGDREHVRNLKNTQLQRGQSPILTTIGQIKAFIRSAMTGNIRDTIKAYGKVGSNFANDVKAVDGNIDISDYYLELDSNRLAHLSDHIHDDGDVRNIPLTQEQVENLTDYIDSYDDILNVVRRKDGSVRIVLGKKINGHAVIVELVSKGRKSVQPVTAWQNTTEYYQNKYGQNNKTQTINTSHPQEGKISGYKPSASSEGTQPFKSESPQTATSIRDSVPSRDSVPQSQAQYNPNFNQNQGGNTGSPAGRPGTQQAVRKATGYGEYGVKAFSELMDASPGMTFDQLRSQFQSAYELGLTDMPTERARLTTDIQRIAFNAGKQDYIMSSAKAAENSKYVKVWSKGGGLVENDYAKALEAKTADTLNTIGKATGTKIIMEEIPAEQNANGYYQASDGTIHIDVNSTDPVMTVVKHELTHRMQALAPKEYRQFRDYAVQTMSEYGWSKDGSHTAVESQQHAYRDASGGKVSLDTESAMDEMAANFTEKILTDEDAMRSFVEHVTKTEEHRTMGQKFFQAVREFIDKLKRVFQGDKAKMDAAAQEQFGATIDQLEKAEALWKEAYRAAEQHAQELSGKAQKNTAWAGGVQYSLKDTQKELTEQYRSTVDAVLDGTFGGTDAVIMGYTPDIYQELGMPSLPFVIGPGHIYSAAKTASEAKADGRFNNRTNYHGLGADAVKHLYEAAEKPVMIISSKDVNPKATPLRSTHSVVSIVDAGRGGKHLLLPIEITASRTVNGTEMDVNVLSSAYEKNVEGLVTEAIAQENAGEIGIYYVAKEAAALLGTRVQFPERLTAAAASHEAVDPTATQVQFLEPQADAAASTGIIRRFSEKINMNLADQTQSQQFKRWFGDWQNKPNTASKVVDEDGKPRVVYHGTAEDIHSFDQGRGGSLTRAADAKEGFFFTSSQRAAEGYAEAAMPRELLALRDEFDRLESLWGDDPELDRQYREARDAYERALTAYRETGGGRTVPVYLNIRNPVVVDFAGASYQGNAGRVEAAIAQAKRDGNDGVILQNILDPLGPRELRETADEYIVFRSEQVKSATENIGTFDRGNPDIRYSLKGQRELMQQYEGKSMTEDGEIYSYDFLTALPDMRVTTLPDVSAVRNSDGKVDTGKVVTAGMKNARSAGAERDGKVFVRNDYTGKQLLVRPGAIRHGLNGGMNRLLTNARLGAVIGDVVKNAVPINALHNKAEGVTGTYAMAAYATDSQGREFVAIVTVEQSDENVSGIEVYDVTHAMSGRQKRGQASDPHTRSRVFHLSNLSRISISDFLGIVNATHQSILSENVLERLGESRNPDGEYTGQVLYSLKGQRELMQQYMEQYGIIPEGEKPHRKARLPKKTGENQRVSQTVRTAMEAKVTPDEAIPDIESLVADGSFSYEAITDKQAIQDADGTIRRNGWDASLRGWFDSVKKGEVSKANTALGWALYNNAANSGNIQTALDILQAMAGHQRSAAQALQATRILKRLSPETQLYQVQRNVESLQEELNSRYGKKNKTELRISEELAGRFMEAKTQTERDEILKDIYRDIGRQMPASFIDKWNAWRYLAMLGNVRTHVRNVVGNAGFVPAVGIKNATATAIEAAVHRVSGGRLNRSKAAGTFTSKAGRALLKAAWSDFDHVQEIAMSGGKYSDFANANRYIEEGRRIFRFKPLEAARKGNSKLLDLEDAWFSRPHYAYAMAQYCRANSITAEQLAGGKAIEPARRYAIHEAQKATYRDTNAFSQMVSGWGRGASGTNAAKKAFNAAVEGILPFRKTPANILARGVEYSPIGLMKSLSYDLAQVKAGKLTGAEAIDNISAGLTGTGLVALGALLASFGLIRGHGGGDEDKKRFEEMLGHQAYSLELPGGASVTLDWLAPEALPFFIGVNLWEQAGADTENVTLSEILTAVSTVTEPLLEMSCLQSLNDVFDSVGYASANGLDALPAALASAATSYLTQGLPTILGQAERSGQEVRMTTYTEKNGFLTSDMQYALGSASARTPGWDFNQIPYIDAWGRKETTGSTLERMGNNFLNPAYTSDVKTSKMEEELLRLYDATGERSVFPSRADKYFTEDGARKDLTAEEYVRYATLKGQKSLALLTELTESKQYKELSDLEKVHAIEDAYDMANQQAKAAVSKYKPDAWITKAGGVDTAAYLVFRANLDALRGENDGKLKQADVAALLTSLELDDEERWSLYFSQYDGKEAHEAHDMGIDAGTYLEFKAATSDMTADKDAEGNSIPGTKKEKVMDYMDTMGLTQDEYDALLEIAGYKSGVDKKSGFGSSSFGSSSFGKSSFGKSSFGS